MHRPWDASTHVGRVGALAVALGIGAAMLTGTGTAWADTSRGDTGSREQSSAQSPSAADATPTNRRADPGPRRGTPRSRPDSSTPPQPVVTQRTVKSRDNDLPAHTQVAATDAAVAVNRPGLQQVSPAAPAAVVRVRPATGVAGRVPAPTAAAAEPTAIGAAPVVLSAAVPAVLADTPAALPATPAALTAPRPASRLLSAIGLASLAGGSGAGTPANSPALWALLGWARRDAGRTGVRLASAQNPLPTAANALVTSPGNLPSSPLGWVTGQRNSAFPGALWTQTNNTRWANVYGTDLGIMWFNGENGKTQLAFGDTFSGPNMTGDWRSNVLLLSEDTNLSDGLTLINTGPAFQFIPAARNQVFFIGSEVTNIPTAAVYANSNNYVNYMSVKSWDSPGRWTTNYSAISQYDEASDKWVLQKQTVRSAGWFRSSKAYQAGDQNFQQMAYVLEPESTVAPGETRYVYAFGTPAGRQGSAFLSRVPETAVTDLAQYEYWDGGSWVNRQAKAAPVIGDSTRSTGIFGWAKDIANNPKFFGGWFAGFTGAKTGGNVSEMSVQYNEYLDKYVVLYGNGANNVILRTADSPEGPWSDPVTLATSVQYPGLYAPMIHPLSGTGALTDSDGAPDINNLYWNMSIWSNYNVVLMKTDLTPMAVTPA
jgi:hypothetical protein